MKWALTFILLILEILQSNLQFIHGTSHVKFKVSMYHIYIFEIVWEEQKQFIVGVALSDTVIL